MSNIAEAPREKLREIVTRIGDRILDDPERCEGLLKDHCGEHRREVSALVGALQERVPMELRSSWQSAMTPEAMRARLVQRLQDHRGLAPEVADWAVDTWSYALGVGLSRTSDRLASHVMGAPGLPPSPAPAQQQPWVGSQIISPNLPAPPPPPPPAAALAQQPPPASGSTLKAAVAVGALALAGYFAMPVITSINSPKEVEKPCVTKAADGSCLDGKETRPVTKKEDTPQPVSTILNTGTALSVRVGEALSSNTASTGQYVHATLTAPAMVNGKQVLPAGAKVVLQIADVDTAGRIHGVPQIKLSLYQVEAGGRNYLASSTAFVAKGPSRTVNTVTKAGIGAAVGCGVGAVVGVFTRKPKKGCGVGAAGGAGAGTAVAATNEIKPAVISQGAVIRFTLLRPLTIG